MWLDGLPPDYSAKIERLSFDNFYHFAALIFAAMRTSAMRPDLFVTVRALGELRSGQSIVSAARGSPAFRMAAFRIRH